MKCQNCGNQVIVSANDTKNTCPFCGRLLLAEPDRLTQLEKRVADLEIAIDAWTQRMAKFVKFCQEEHKYTPGPGVTK